MAGTGGKIESDSRSAIDLRIAHVTDYIVFLKLTDWFEQLNLVSVRVGWKNMFDHNICSQTLSLIVNCQGVDIVFALRIDHGCEFDCQIHFGYARLDCHCRHDSD
jgi:hypothetical protein